MFKVLLTGFILDSKVFMNLPLANVSGLTRFRLLMILIVPIFISNYVVTYIFPEGRRLNDFDGALSLVLLHEK